jgi:hypothetical protein
LTRCDESTVDVSSEAAVTATLCKNEEEEEFRGVEKEEETSRNTILNHSRPARHTFRIVGNSEAAAGSDQAKAEPSRIKFYPPHE